jgi:hypothetical protein
MRCPGLHCEGCGDHGRGGGCAVVVLIGGIAVAVEVLEWIAAHALELMAITAACVVLAVAAVVALARWGDRREARHATARPFLTAREVPGIGNGPASLPTPAERPALGFRDLHIHLDGLPADEQAAVIRRALNQ